MGWIPRCSSLQMVHPFISTSNFFSVTPSMGVLFPILRRGEVSTLWSSFFLSFIAVSCEAMLWTSKHRSGCSQSAFGWNTGPPMDELEKVLKELKGSATLQVEQYELTSTPRAHLQLHMLQKMAQSAIIGKRGPFVLQTLYAPVQGNTRAKKWEWVGRGAGQGEGIGDFWTSI